MRPAAAAVPDAIPQNRRPAGASPRLDKGSVILVRAFVAFGSLLVLALIGAVVAPYFIDWTAYRSDFEREASKILGRPVVVRGAASARLLPFPSVTFNDVVVAGETGEPLMTIDRFRMDAELAPYLSGEIRIFSMQLEEPGEPRPISPSGEVDGFAVSPDGSTVALTLDRKPMLIKLSDGTPRPLPSGKYYELPIAWSSDGKSVFMADMLVGSEISRLDVATGARTPWKTLLPSDSAGVTRVTTVRMIDGGRSYAYSYVRRLSQLFVISGLK